MEITIEDVKKFLAENKDDDEVKELVKSLVPEHTITVDEVSEFLGTEDGQKLIQPIADKRVTDAVLKRDKYWKEEALEPEVKKRVAAEILKLNPKADPVVEQLNEMKRRLEEQDRVNIMDKRKRAIAEKALELKVEPFFINDFLPASDEEGTLYLQKIAEHDKKVADKAINDLMASKSFVPNGGKPVQKHADLSNIDLKTAMAMEESGELDTALNS